MSFSPQPALWYLLLNGHGFHSTNIKPGHVYSLTHFDIHSSVQLIQLGQKICPIFLFQQSSILQTSQKQPQKGGGSSPLYMMLSMIFSNWVHVMNSVNLNRVPPKMFTSFLHQNKHQSTPLTDDIRTQSPIQ